MHFKTLGTPKDSEPLFSGTLSPIETLIPGDLPPKGIIRLLDINIVAIILILLFVSHLPNLRNKTNFYKID